MIEIFGSQGGATGGMGSGNPAQLAHGISVALYNTAFGLMVAIPALIFWRYFRSRVDAYLLTLELSSEQFVRHLGGAPCNLAVNLCRQGVRAALYTMVGTDAFGRFVKRQLADEGVVTNQDAPDTDQAGAASDGTADINDAPPCAGVSAEHIEIAADVDLTIGVVGHAGDGNIHFNITQPKGADPKAYLDQREEMNRIIHDIVVRMGGSISAEHGVGELKREEIVERAASLPAGLKRLLADRGVSVMGAETGRRRYEVNIRVGSGTRRVVKIPRTSIFGAIALGSKGTFDGVTYTVIGRLKRKADTGSSQISSLGFKTKARAMPMRWHWPPENSCG